jgi:hypothetical protein
MHLSRTRLTLAGVAIGCDSRGRMHASDAQPVLVGERKLDLYPDAIVIARPHRLTPNQ